MGKILYPVGTKVQIRDWKLDELKYEGHTYDRRKRVVEEYVKGSSTPYKLEGINKSFSVDEIKSYRPSSSAVKNDRVADSAPVASVQNSLNAKEMREIIHAELSQVRDGLKREIIEEIDSREIDRQIAQQELNNTIASIDAEEVSTPMETIRQKLIYAAKPKQERVLQEAEILSNGYLTEQGRRVVLDLIWEGDKDLQTAVFKAVEKLNKKNSKKSKDSDDE